VYGLAVFALLAGTVPAHAKDLPKKIGYTFYQEGNRIGHSTIRTSRSPKGLVVMRSTTTIQSPGPNLSVTSQTDVDPTNWTVRRFQWKGTVSGSPYKGDLTYDGVSYSGFMSQGGERVEESRTAGSPHVLFMQNYVPSHQIAIARAQMASGKEAQGWEVLFPSSYSQHKATVSIASNVLVESDKREVVCKKLVVKLQGSSVFASYYDESLGLPVYIVFPENGTEIFLDNFYGDDPISRFVPKETGSGQ